LALLRTISAAAVAVAALHEGGTAAAQSYWPNSRPAWPSPPRQTTVTVPMQPGEKPGAASFEPQAFAARGDVLDPWCKTATTAVNAANCGDTELRALAIERLRAFDQARSRLSWDQQKALAADQNRWATALPYTCDLESDEPPSLPLDPAVKECLVREGRSRLAFLQAYGAAAARPNPAAPATAAKPPATAATPATSSPQPQPAGTATQTPPSQLVGGAAPPWAATNSGTIGSEPPRR
jgi:uncharacterized protein YecT (DUF1311 family)